MENIEVSNDYDVVVCGGGPAGFGAAAAACANGAKTLLLEACSCLGGMNNAFVSTWCDTPLGPSALYLLEEMRRLGAVTVKRNPERYHSEGRYTFDLELMKITQMSILDKLGCDILLLSTAESAFMEDGQVQGVYVANKNGRRLYKCKTLIDCTADAQIAVSAGAEFMYGDPEDGRVQHANFRFKFESLPHGSTDYTVDELEELFGRARRSGQISIPSSCFTPSPDRFPLSNSGRISNNWEIAGVDVSDAVQLSRMLRECHCALFDLLKFCRNNLAGYEQISVRALPGLPGSRESRRIMGEYVLSRDDVIDGRKFADGLVRASFWCDFHDSPPGTTLPYSLDYINRHRPANGDWYEIPYRCLLPRQCSNLLVAGRCISVDRWAQASMRVMPTCMYTGTASGIAASEALRKKIPVNEIDGVGMKEFMHHFKI